MQAKAIEMQPKTATKILFNTVAEKSLIFLQQNGSQKSLNTTAEIALRLDDRELRLPLKTQETNKPGKPCLSPRMSITNKGSN
uniref:Uncharacterized protein n=1 Tax=Arion vulgaris TaxID=1028688 RepID=A0A0B6YYD1_9EUPU